MDDFFEGSEESWGVALKNRQDYKMCRIYKINLNYVLRFHHVCFESLN